MANDGTPAKQNTVTDISIADLIAAPLKAAADAQLDLAKSTVEFIHSVGVEKDPGGRDRLKTLSMRLQRPARDGGKTDSVFIQAPLLAIVPVPNLAVEEVDINFQMEVTSTAKTQSTEQEDGGQAVTVCGKVSSGAGQTRETNQSAKYQIQVKARRQETPEGLSRILDVLAAAVTPGTEPEEKE